MPQKTSQNSLRNVALTASKAYRTKEGITVPEWDGAKVTLREPSGDARVKFREIVNPQLAEGEEAPTLTEAEKFLRNKEADVVLFIDVLLDENGERVFSDEDQEQVSKIYGPVHSRLLAQALNLGMSQKKRESRKAAADLLPDVAGAPVGAYSPRTAPDHDRQRAQNVDRVRPHQSDW